jgi:hypothetical protein
MDTVLMTAAQMNRLLDIIGCTHTVTARPGEPVGPYVDHLLNHLDEYLHGSETRDERPE